MSHMKIKYVSGMMKYYGINAFDVTVDIIMEEVLIPPPKKKKYFEHIWKKEKVDILFIK